MVIVADKQKLVAFPFSGWEQSCARMGWSSMWGNILPAFPNFNGIKPAVEATTSCGLRFYRRRNILPFLPDSEEKEWALEFRTSFHVQ